MATKRSHSEIAEYIPKHPSVKRAQEVDNNPPFEQLKLKLYKSHVQSQTRNVVHWFRTQDLRAEDNLALARAAELAAKSEKKGHKLITVFIVEPNVYKNHGIGPSRLAFMVSSLRKLASQLKELGIPLVPLLAMSRKERLTKFNEFLDANDVSHVFANWEYEFDELQRDISIADSLFEKRITFRLEHDQTVVEPGLVTNAKDQPLRVFTPFWNAWTPMIAKNPKKYYLTIADPPAKRDRPDNDDLFQKFDEFDFEQALNIDLADRHLQTVTKLWPSGHDAALSRLHEFLDKKIHDYGKERSIPAKDCTSRMSPYFATGTISVREALAITRKRANNDKNFGTSNTGVDSWVREIAFREFYRQMIATAQPHVAMNMPTSLKLAEVRTEDDEDGWKRWCEGRTGIPFVDAGMRQLNHEAYMHNRLRMNVASYLRMNLLLDYRLGMQYFANKLVDWDCCNNAFGWDPNYTVFNGIIQAEKNDPDGEYIRKWVPELKDVPGKAIFDPHGRLSRSEFEKLGYPAPQIEQSEAKDRAMQRYKESGKRMKEEHND